MLQPKILVPVDFSDCSINALTYAVEFAKYLNAEITILHAFNIPVTHGELGAGAIVNTLATGIEEDVQENFTKLIDQVPELPKIHYNTVLKHNYVTDAVSKYSNKNKIDFIIMGTMGANGIDELLIGSNTYSLIKKSNCPVIAVPKIATFEKPKNIALASDYQSINEHVIDPLKTITKLFNSEVHILHINDIRKIEKEEANEARKFERYFKEVHHHFNLIVNEDFEDGLETYITDHEMDMIAIIPRKHNFIDRIIGNSASKKIIFHTNIPLLALPE